MLTDPIDALPGDVSSFPSQAPLSGLLIPFLVELGRMLQLDSMSLRVPEGLSVGCQGPRSILWVIAVQPLLMQALILLRAGRTALALRRQRSAAVRLSVPGAWAVSWALARHFWSLAWSIMFVWSVPIRLCCAMLSLCFFSLSRRIRRRNSAMCHQLSVEHTNYFQHAEHFQQFYI